MWKQRDRLAWRILLSSALLVTVAWSYVLLGRSADWQGWLRPTVVVVGVGAAAVLLVVDRLPQRAALAFAGLAVVAGLAGPAAYSVQTAVAAHAGSIPSAGPAVAGAGLGPGGGGPGGGGPGGGTGGPLDAGSPSTELEQLLQTDASSYTWAAAAVGANSAAGYQLAIGAPVMSLGGFNGSDPYPTLAMFQQYVKSGKVHYFIAGGGMGQANGGSSATTEITTWVASRFTAVTVGGATVYDLTAGASD